MLYFGLVKKGYADLKTVKKLDTFEIMDILEYESILNDIELLEYEEAKSNRD